MDGFRVDLTALTRASDGIRETIDSTTRKPVSDLDPPAETFGHDRLATTVADFCERWNQGVTHLVEDAKVIAGRLQQRSFGELRSIAADPQRQHAPEKADTMTANDQDFANLSLAQAENHDWGHPRYRVRGS